MLGYKYSYSGGTAALTEQEKSRVRFDSGLGESWRGGRGDDVNGEKGLRVGDKAGNSQTRAEQSRYKQVQGYHGLPSTLLSSSE